MAGGVEEGEPGPAMRDSSYTYDAGWDDCHVLWIDRQREWVSTHLREAELQRAVWREGGDWGSGVAKERGSGVDVVRRA